MDGLEISELKLSEILKDNNSFRFDSEYFRKEYLSTINKLSMFTIDTVGSLAKVSDGDHSKFPDNQLAEVRYLQAKDIKNFFLSDENPVFVSKSYFDKQKRSHIFEENILISIMGNVGDIAITPKGFKPCMANRAVAILKNIKKVSPYFLFTFLFTKIANLQLERLKNGGVQERVNLEVLSNVKIPILHDTIQEKTAKFVKSAYQKLEESKKLYAEAETLLLSELGLNDFTLSNELVAIKSFSESFDASGRLDSEYYQLKYDEIIERIKSYKGGFELTSEHFEQNKTTYQRVKENYNYIEIGDVNVSNGEINFNIIPTEELPDNAKIKVSQGDILISKVRPYRGAVGIIEVEDEDLICSGAFTVLRENGRINKETLVTLFRLSFYKELLLKYNVGTSYPVIKDEDVLNIPIPLINENTQKIIAEKISESFTFRRESKKLLEEAKMTVERAIEKGEDNA